MPSSTRPLRMTTSYPLSGTARAADTGTGAVTGDVRGGVAQAVIVASVTNRMERRMRWLP